MTDTLRSGALAKTSIGSSRFPSNTTLPFSTRVTTFATAVLPPSASTYFATTEAPEGQAAVGSLSESFPARAGLDPLDVIAGIGSGRMAPRWQVLHVTSRW